MEGVWVLESHARARAGSTHRAWLFGEIDLLEFLVKFETLLLWVGALTIPMTY
jgi:hypothetical protein